MKMHSVGKTAASWLERSVFWPAGRLIRYLLALEQQLLCYKGLVSGSTVARLTVLAALRQDTADCHCLDSAS